MSKLELENRIITKCEECSYEIDSLTEDMYCDNTIIICVLCHEDREYD